MSEMKKLSGEEIFANMTNHNIKLLEDGTDDTDFSPRTVRVCTVYTREDVALLVFQVGKVQSQLSGIQTTLYIIAIMGLVALIRLWLFLGV